MTKENITTQLNITRERMIQLLNEDLAREFRELHLPHELAVLPCGHYSSGKAPFKFIDAWLLTRFLQRALC